MTTTQEHNQIIGKFIGWIPYNGLNPKWNYSFETNNLFHVNKCVTQDELQFHTSWDWLMPVVDKINAIEYGDYITEFSITKDNVRLVTQVNSKVRKKLKLNNKVLNVNIYYFDVENLSKIEATYQAVVQFIEWYNENKV